MKYVVLVCRILLGLGFTVFGANILVPFMPQPPPVPGSLTEQFMQVMAMSTSYMKVVGAFQLIGGLCVLSGRLAPLGTALLAPVLVNIIAFHVFIQNGEGLVPGIVFSIFEIVVIYGYRNHFAPLFSTNAKPAV